MLLGDMGAEVIKIENARRGRPGAPAGRDTRRPQLVFRWVRPQQAVPDAQLRHEEGREVLAELIAGSDVLVENFRPGVRARIGFDEKRLKALNRDLVCCHITGFNGFENYLVAAFKKKKVDLLVVSDRSQADFEITGFADHNRAGWAKIIFGSGLPESEASIQVVNLRTSIVAYAVGSYKVDAINGKKSTAEHLAKNLRQKMERDDKRLNK